MIWEIQEKKLAVSHILTLTDWGGGGNFPGGYLQLLSRRTLKHMGSWLCRPAAVQSDPVCRVAVAAEYGGCSVTCS